jgi:4-amino-4-deoxy-L-arabinose transferase-like glycosyltransferase
MTQSIEQLDRTSAAGDATPRRRRLRRLRALPPELWALLGVTALLALAWTVAMAPFQPPDEVEHFAYAQRLAETGTRPSPDAGPSGLSTEQSAAVGYLNLLSLRGIPTAREADNPLEQRAWARLERGLPAGARADGAGPNPAARNPPLYYAYEAVPYRLFGWTGLFSRLFAMRVASGALLVATVLLTYLLASELFAARWLRLLAAGVVALQPELGFLGGSVNPDILLVATWTAFLLVGVRLLRHGATRGRVAALLACAAAAALTHGRGLPLVVPALFVGGVLIARLPPARRRLEAAWAGGALLALAGAAAAVLARGGVYGGQLSASGHALTPGGFLDTTWQFYFPRLGFMSPRPGPAYGFRQVMETFYGTFGSLEIRLPEWTYGALHLASLATLALVAALLVARRGALRGRWPIVGFLGVTLVALMLTLHAVSYRSLASGSTDPIIVGRYVLPVVALLGLAVAFVASSLPRRLGACLAGWVLGAGVLLQIAGLAITAARFYA